MMRGIRGRRGAASSDYVIWTILGLGVLAVAGILLFGSGNLIEKIRAYGGGKSNLAETVTSCNSMCDLKTPRDVTLDDGTKVKATCEDLAKEETGGCFVGGDLSKRIQFVDTTTPTTPTDKDFNLDACKKLDPQLTNSKCHNGVNGPEIKASSLILKNIKDANAVGEIECNRAGLNPKYVKGWIAQSISCTGAG